MPRIFRRLACLLAFIPAFAFADEAAVNTANLLGWIDTSNAPLQCKVTSCASCGGYYDTSTLPTPSNIAFADAQTVINAPPPIHYQVNGDAQFDNGVTITQPGRTFYADQATITPDLKTGKLVSVDAQGHIRIAQPGQLLLADSVKANLINHEAELSNVHYLMKVGVNSPGALNTTDPNFTGYASGHSVQVNQLNQTQYQLSNASYSTCSPVSRTWELDAKKIDLDQAEGEGTAHDTTLRIHGVPVFYLPYFDFPLTDQRKSGFLYGTVGGGTTSGFNLGIPYYFNLAPNYDDTLTGTLYTKRGILFDNYFRYLTKTSAGTIEAQVIPYDQEYSDQTRGSFSIINITNFNDHWQSNLNYNYVSDDSYLQDFSTQNLTGANQTLLNRSLNLVYQNTHWNFTGVLQSFQIINQALLTANSPYNELPSLSLTGQYPNIYGPLSLSAATSVVNFTKETTTSFAITPVQGQRFNITPTISLPFTQSYGYFTPSVSLSNTDYALNNNVQNGYPKSSPIANVPIFNVDASAYLNRSFSVKSQNGWSQTISPRLFYLYVPTVNQNNIPIFDTTIIPFSYSQLFALNRFSGLDRIGNANQLSYALSTTVNNPTGQQFLSAGLGQILYLTDRSTSLCQNQPGQPPCVQTENPTYNQRFSDLAGYFTYNINTAWSLNANATYNMLNPNLDSQEYFLSYQPSTIDLFNVGYQANRQNYSLLSTQQILAGTTPPVSSLVNTSFLWGFTPSWALIGDLNYSIENSGMVSEFGGFQYSACCFAIRLMAYRYVVNNNPNTPSVMTGQMDTVWMVQFLLKGLGSTSGQSNALLATMPGYHGQLGF